LVPLRAGYRLEDLGHTPFSRQIKVQNSDVDHVLMDLTENCHLVSPLLAGGSRQHTDGSWIGGWCGSPGRAAL